MIIGKLMDVVMPQFVQDFAQDHSTQSSELHRAHHVASQAGLILVLGLCRIGVIAAHSQLNHASRSSSITPRSHLRAP